MALPPITQFSRYLAVYNSSGVLQVLELPDSPKRALAYFDGTNITLVTGENAQPIILDSLEQVEGGTHPHILIMRPSGQIMRFTTPADFTGKAQLVSDGGSISWEEISGTLRQIPDTGTGLLVIDGGGVTLINGEGNKMVYVKDGIPTEIAVPSGNGKIFQIVNGEPVFADPVASSASGGIVGTGIGGVSAQNTTSTTVTLTAPVFVVKDSGDDSLTTLENVNVSASLAAPDGVGGVDNGGAQNTRFYHMWIVNNGTLTNMILSESLTAPDLTNAAAYVKYGLAGTFYVRGDGTIRSFMQRGTQIDALETEWGTNLNITTSFTSITGAVNLNTLIPPNALRVRGNAGGSAAATAALQMQIASNSDGVGKQFLGDLTTFNNGTSVASMNYDGFKYDVGRFDIPVNTPLSPTIYWRAATAATGKRRITITGYRIRG